MDSQKITTEELTSIFGSYLPLSAMEVLTDTVRYPTPEVARTRLREIADQRRAQLLDPAAIDQLLESLRQRAHEEAAAHRAFVDMRYGPTYDSVSYTDTSAWIAADTIEALRPPKSPLFIATTTVERTQQ